jgi:hypothetical protein
LTEQTREAIDNYIKAPARGPVSSHLQVVATMDAA